MQRMAWLAANMQKREKSRESYSSKTYEKNYRNTPDILLS